MGRLVAQFFVATSEGQPQLMFQLLKVRKFPLYASQFFFQASANQRTGLQAVFS